MRSLFPSSYDRADVLMSAGCSTFFSAALILVIPRFGILLLEILFGLFFIGCALMARSTASPAGAGQGRRRDVKEHKGEMVRPIRRSNDCRSDRGSDLHRRTAEEGGLVRRHGGYPAAHPVRGGHSAQAPSDGVPRRPQENETGSASLQRPTMQSARRGRQPRGSETDRPDLSRQRWRSRMKGSEPTMPVNGAETLVDAKTTQPPVGDGRNARATADSKAPPSRGAATRRRRDRQDNSKTSGEERFFLASGSGHGDVPALGRECASEAEAIIDAFRERVNFYQGCRISDTGGRGSVRGTDLTEGWTKEE